MQLDCIKTSDTAKYIFKKQNYKLSTLIFFLVFPRLTQICSK